jgi:hypothetical protein
MSRFLFVKHGCRACLEYKRVLPRINLRLPIDKQIVLRDNFQNESFGIIPHLVQERLSREDFKDYPLLYMDGNIYLGGVRSAIFKAFVVKFLEDDSFSPIENL